MLLNKFMGDQTIGKVKYAPGYGTTEEERQQRRALKIGSPKVVKSSTPLASEVTACFDKDKVAHPSLVGCGKCGKTYAVGDKFCGRCGSPNLTGLGFTPTHADTNNQAQSKEHFAREHALDVEFEQARAVHRVVRAMHDGECPKCHRLFESKEMVWAPGNAGNPNSAHKCPNRQCGFTISKEEMQAAINLFAPVMEKNLEVFEEWRASLKDPKPEELLAEVSYEIPPTRGIFKVYFEENSKEDDQPFIDALHDIYPTAILRGVKRNVKPVDPKGKISISRFGNTIPVSKEWFDDANAAKGAADYANERLPGMINFFDDVEKAADIAKHLDRCTNPNCCPAEDIEGD